MKQEKTLVYRGSGSDLATDVAAILSPEEMRRFLENLPAPVSPIQPPKGQSDEVKLLRLENARLFEMVQNLTITKNDLELKALIGAPQASEAPVEILIERYRRAVVEREHKINPETENAKRSAYKDLVSAYTQPQASEADLALMDAFIAEVCHNGGQHSEEMDDWCEANKARWKRIRALVAGSKPGKEGVDSA